MIVGGVSEVSVSSMDDSLKKLLKCPIEIFWEILTFLPLCDLKKVLLTSKLFFDIIQKTNILRDRVKKIRPSYKPTDKNPNWGIILSEVLSNLESYPRSYEGQNFMFRIYFSPKIYRFFFTFYGNVYTGGMSAASHCEEVFMSCGELIWVKDDICDLHFLHLSNEIIGMLDDQSDKKIDIKVNNVKIPEHGEMKYLIVKGVNDEPPHNIQGMILKRVNPKKQPNVNSDLEWMEIAFNEKPMKKCLEDNGFM